MSAEEYDNIQDIHDILMKSITKEKCDELLLNDYTIIDNFLGNEISKQLLNELKLNESLQENITLVNLYYPRLDYIFSNEIQKYNSYNLFAEIGGILSFYLGVSVFTLIEILETLLEFVLNQMSQQKNAIVPENLS